MFTVYRPEEFTKDNVLVISILPIFKMPTKTNFKIKTKVFYLLMSMKYLKMFALFIFTEIFLLFVLIPIYPILNYHLHYSDIS